MHFIAIVLVVLVLLGLFGKRGVAAAGSTALGCIFMFLVYMLVFGVRR
jgi:hypothetical protein